MQYKIPIQIENEDTIVLGLSLRQLTIMMVWAGLGYAVFKSLETRVSPQAGLIFASPFVLIGIVIALIKVAEMTFLPTILNFFRMTLNSKTRLWSQGTDSYSDIDVGYVAVNQQKAPAVSKKSLESAMNEDETITENILKL
jgi:hypothetical protein